MRSSHGPRRRPRAVSVGRAAELSVARSARRSAARSAAPSVALAAALAVLALAGLQALGGAGRDGGATVSAARAGAAQAAQRPAAALTLGRRASQTGTVTATAVATRTSTATPGVTPTPAPTEVAPPVDLALAGLDPSGLRYDAQALTVTGRVTVQLRNMNYRPVSGPVRARVYFDLDADGLQDPGEALLAELRGALPPGETGEGLGGGERWALGGDVPPLAAPYRDALVAAELRYEGPANDRWDGDDRADSAAACLRPADPGGWADAGLQPMLEWAWPGGRPIEAPDSVQVRHAPVAADLTGDGVPELVFGTVAPEIGANAAYLRAVDGRSGETLFTRLAPEDSIFALASPALADLDGDGRIEIVALSAAPETMDGAAPTQLVAFASDGRRLWRSTDDEPFAPEMRSVAGVAIADVDGDGRPEILAGNRVVDPRAPRRTNRGLPGAIVADLNLDGAVELLSGQELQRASWSDGRLRWSRAAHNERLVTDTKRLDALLPVDRYGLPARQAAVAHVSAGGVLHLLSYRLGFLAFGRDMPDGSSAGSAAQGGPPVVADVDGDGHADVGLAGQRSFALFTVSPAGFPQGLRTRGLYAQTQDTSFGFTAASAFDFDGDGRYEIAYADERSVYLFGMDGPEARDLDTRWRADRPSSTNREMPIVLDLDADGRAELVVPQEPGGAGGDGIRVYGNPRWMTARRLWNQHRYWISNVDDRGRIPAVPEAGWLRHGTFRANPVPRGLGDARAAADLSVSRLQVFDAGAEGVTISALLANGGAAPAGPGILLRAYADGAPEPVASLLFEEVLGPGERRSVDLPWTTREPVGRELRVVVDDPAGDPAYDWPECDEANNELRWTVSGIAIPRPSPSPSPTPSPTPSQTTSPRATPSATPTPSPSASPSPTASGSPSATASASPAPPTPRPGPIFLPFALRDEPGCLPPRGTDWLFLLDASASMRDPAAQGGPSAFAAARDALAEAGAALPPEARLGLLLFGADARVVAGLDAPRAEALARLRALDEGDTAPGATLDAGLALAARAAADAPRAGRRTALLLVTDAQRVDRAVARRAREAAEAARRDGLTILALGLGPEADAALLAELAGAPARRALAEEGAPDAALDALLAGAVCVLP